MDEMIAVPQVTLQPFEKGEFYFIGPINQPRKITCVRYIIITNDYLTRWVEEALIKDCTTMTTTRFLFKNVVTIFGSLNILMSDEGTYFINQTIRVMIKEFHIQHKRSTPYHPHVNGIVKAFNKILENALTI